MSKNLTPVSTFTATITVPEDNDAATGAAFESAYQALANRTEHLKDNKATGAASSTDNGIPRFDGTGGKTLQTSGVSISDAAEVVYNSPPTRTVTIGPACFTSCGDAGATEWSFKSTGGAWESVDNSGQISCNLEDHVPTGAVVTEIVALVNPGTARATSGNRMALELRQELIPFSNPSGSTGSGQTAFQRDDGTTDQQNITLDASSSIALSPLTIDRGAELSYQINIIAGNDASTNIDRFYGVRVTFTDPGPRNY
jgi:hypothetical protein